MIVVATYVLTSGQYPGGHEHAVVSTLQCGICRYACGAGLNAYRKKHAVRCMCINLRAWSVLHKMVCVYTTRPGSGLPVVVQFLPDFRWAKGLLARADKIAWRCKLELVSCLYSILLRRAQMNAVHFVTVQN